MGDFHMSWNIFFTGTFEEVTAANAQINANCGFPDEYTDNWANPQQAYEQDFWFILMPPPEGYRDPVNSWTQEQMIAGVVNVIPQESQSNWWPPVPPEKKPSLLKRIVNAISELFE